MKLLVLAALVSVNASAFVDVPNIQSDSDYAKFKIERACDVELADSTVGMIDEVDGMTVYTAVNAEGEEVAAATAKSSFILSKATCL